MMSTMENTPVIYDYGGPRRLRRKSPTDSANEAKDASSNSADDTESAASVQEFTTPNYLSNENIIIEEEEEEVKEADDEADGCEEEEVTGEGEEEEEGEDEEDMEMSPEEKKVRPSCWRPNSKIIRCASLRY